MESQDTVATADLVEIVNSLTPEQQETVRQFIAFLKGNEVTGSPFLKAVDEFIEHHPALLSSLAQ
jgi:hypothetical protein